MTKCTHLAAGCQARELWHAAKDDRAFSGINRVVWAADKIIFPLSPPTDEWDRWYSVALNGGQTADPVLLTTNDGLINDGVADRTFVTTTTSRDGKTFFWATNANDIEKRHVWSVPVAGGTPKQVSTDAGVEVSPTLLPSGKIGVLFFDAKQPASIGLVPADRTLAEPAAKVILDNP